MYDALPLQVARHPSESESYLVARVLAYAVEYTEGIAFSRGVSDADEPAILVRDLTGRIQAWIEVGTPEAERLHKAAKQAPRVAVYTHKDPAQFLSRLAGAHIHRAGALELYAFERGLIAGVVERLERRMAFALSIAERELFVSIGNDTISGRITRLGLE